VLVLDRQRCEREHGSHQRDTDAASIDCGLCSLRGSERDRYQRLYTAINTSNGAIITQYTIQQNDHGSDDDYDDEE